MKHSPRIRKTLKWTSAAMVVVLVVVWCCSQRWRVMAGHDDWVMSTRRHGLGMLTLIAMCEEGAADGWFGPIVDSQWNEDSMDQLWPVFEPGLSGRGVHVPYWLPLLMFGATWLMLHRRDRRFSRVEQGCCLKCGYDRAGIAGTAACPECGEPPRA